MAFKRRKKARDRELVETLDCTGRVCLKAVGESFYQDALAAIAGRTEDGVELEAVAILSPEPDNPHDQNAVGVYIAGQKVGHLSRSDAAIVHRPLADAIDSGTHVSCRARIVGGWDRGPRDQGHFGVMIWIDPEAMGISASEFSERDARSREPVPDRQLGLYQGEHYTQYVDTVKYLRRNGKDADAEELLTSLLDVIEHESLVSGHGVAPWFYEQLATIYRQRNDAESELRILERFASQRHAPGAGPPKLLRRLDRLRAKLE